MDKNILIIDDSALMRRMLSDIIVKNSKFNVAGLAKNGQTALEMLRENKSKFDVILLDFFLPDMNADEILIQIEKLGIQSKVILISGVIKEDAMEIIQALEDGAFDFVTKPMNFMGTNNHFQKKLLQRIELAMSEMEKARKIKQKKISPVSTVKTEPVLINLHSERKKKGSVEGEKLIALACSTGGPRALHQVIPKLPKNMNAPMVIVQHMPKGFTKSLAMRLDEISQVTVKEGEDGDVLEKGVVYIAPGGAQMRVAKNKGQYVLKITDEPARNGLRPCADIMYESLVQSDYAEIVCVVLTGMGGDGTAGIRELEKQNNIYSITQNAETCTVYGMPKVLYESGLADVVLPLQDIAEAIWKHVGVQ